MNGVNLVGVLAGTAVFLLPYLFLKVWRARHPVHAGAFAWGVFVWIMAFGLGWALVEVCGDATASFLRVFTPGLADGVRSNLAAALIYAVVETSLILWVALKGSYEDGSWEKAVCFGLGFGAAEAILYGAGLVLVWARPGLLPAATRTSMEGLPWLSAAAPVVERTFSYLTEMYAALAVFFGVRSKAWKWVLGGGAIKFAFYSVTAVGWGLGSNMDLLHSARDLWTVELAVLAFGALGLSGLLHLGYVYHRMGDGPGLEAPAKPGARASSEPAKKEVKAPAPAAPEPA